jgi:hypothetical protein
MNRNFCKHVVVAVLLIIGQLAGRSQGTFVNLDFESPILPLTPDPFFQVPITNALPGWAGYIGGSQVDRVVYNTVSLGAAAISFHDSMSLETPFNGSHFVILQSSFPGGSISPTLAQTGQIPGSAQSLVFYYYNVNIQVSFAGQSLTVFDLGAAGGTSQYRRAGADITGLAGQTGELRFSAINSGGSLDFIQFSNEPIPEPNALGLLAFGALLLGGRFFKTRS